RRRRPVVQHLVFAIHFVSYMLLLTMAVIYGFIVLAPPLRAIGIFISRTGFDQLSGVGMAIGTIAYLFFALRRVYGDGKIAALAKAVAGFAALVGILVAYRL